MTSRLSPRHLQALAPAGDPELLRAYAEHGDATAFAHLTLRYARLARRAAAEVCPAAADDVAQAALTLLGRKAAGLVGRESVAGWVFETARRLSLKARTAAARRARHEAHAMSPAPASDPLDDLSFREVRAVVAAEVARLPDDLRVPLVLCYWEGVSRPAAADRLGCSVSTLQRRLDAGRDLLGARLARRGFVGSAVLAALTTIQAAQAGPHTRSASFATPSMPAVLGRSPKSAFLAMAATVVTASALALGLAPAGDPTSPPTDAKPTEGAKAPVALVDVFGDPLPPGAVARLGTTRFRTADFPKQLAVAPDGKRVVSTQFLQHVRLTVWEADTGRSIRETELPDYPQSEAICWPADDRGLAAMKVGPKDYVVWEFTEPAAQPPRGDKSNSFTVGTFSASAFSPDGTLIAGGERAGPQATAGKLQVWPVHPGRSVREATPLFTLDTADGFVALMFTTDGKRLVGITQGREPARMAPRKGAGPIAVEAGAQADTAHVFVWDASTGKELTTFAVPADGFPLDGMNRLSRHAVSPDGMTLFAPAKNGHVKAFDLATGKERFDTLAFGPPDEKTKAQLPGFKSQIGVLAVTSDGRTVVAAEAMGRTVGLDAATGKERWRGGREMEPIYALATFPDGKRFALGHGSRQIGIYDAATGKPLVEPTGPRGGLAAVGITPDGKTAVTSGWTNTLFWWDLATGRVTRTVDAESAVRVRIGGFSPDGKRAVGHEGVFDTTTGKRVAPLELSGLRWFSSAPGRVAWLADGTFVVGDEEHRAARFSADGKTVAQYVAAPVGKPGTGLVVEGVAVRPDGKTVVLTGEGAPENGMRSDVGWVVVFDATTGAKVRDWRSKANGGFTSAAFLPDGSRVILGRRVYPLIRRIDQQDPVPDLTTAVVLFDSATGESVTPFDAPDAAARDRWVRSVAASTTGAQVATVEWDNSLTVYETASGAVRHRLKGHRGEVAQVAFTPDGNRLVSVSSDGTGLVWDVAPPRPAAPTPLTEADRERRWAALLATDGQSAHRAMGELAADPAGTAAFLKANLKPTPVPTAANLDQVLAKLGTAGFADREAAARELNLWGSLATAGVRAKLPAVTSAEVRQRLDEFLKQHDVPGRTTGGRLREIRAVELLEVVGTPEARAVLVNLAAGDTPLARAAAAAVRRLREQ
jgi:RNA polymerase sigma factor (sigma-70 family)